MPDLLVLDRVSAGYGATVIVEDVSVSLARGAALAVLGRNGVGKTTLMRTIAGHTDLHGGRVLFDGSAIERARPWRRARLGIGYVPQERDVFPSLTVVENLTVAARPGPWTLDAIFELFPSLATRRRHFGSQLSGGEQQMLSIGRALLLQPALLLLDEPFEGLAPTLVRQLTRVFVRVRESGLAIVLAEQQARLSLSMTDHAIVLVRGRVELAGSSRALLDAPARLEEALTVRPRSDDDSAGPAATPSSVSS